MKSFSKKRLMISGALFLLIIVLILLINSGIFTYSRYETQVSSQNSITTAVYLLNDEYQRINVQLPDVIPGNNQYKYSFSVSNYNEDEHCDTNLKYRIHIRTTTNVDITYQLYNAVGDDLQNAPSVILNNDVVQDRYGTHFRHIYTDYRTMLYSEDKIDNYTIVFTFPNDFKNSQYSGIVELIEINIESSQKLDSDT